MICASRGSSDCKHMEWFLRQEKHLYYAAGETNTGNMSSTEGE